MEYLHAIIEINGVKLQVVGNYWPGEAASCDSPGEPESVEIESILTERGDDIGGMVAYFDDLQEHVEQAALEAHKDRKDWQREEAAISRREMAREAA